MSVTVDEVPTRDPTPARTKDGGRRNRRRVAVVVVVALAVAGTTLALVFLGPAPAPPRPPGLTWFWNGTYASGGSSNYPVGNDIMWGQGPPTQTYPDDARCALVVPGARDLVDVPCNAGSWHWAGTYPLPKIVFLVVENGKAVTFPVMTASS